MDNDSVLLECLLNETSQALNNGMIGVDIGRSGSKNLVALKSRCIQCKDVNHMIVTIHENECSIHGNHINDIRRDDVKIHPSCSKHIYSRLNQHTNGKIDERDIVNTTFYSYKIKTSNDNLETHAACIKFRYPVGAKYGRNLYKTYCLCVSSKFPHQINLYAGLKLLAMMSSEARDREISVFDDFDDFSRIFIGMNETKGKFFLHEHPDHVESISAVKSYLQSHIPFPNIYYDGNSYEILYFPSWNGHIYVAIDLVYPLGSSVVYAFDINLKEHIRIAENEALLKNLIETLIEAIAKDLEQSKESTI